MHRLSSNCFNPSPPVPAVIEPTPRDKLCPPLPSFPEFSRNFLRHEKPVNGTSVTTPPHLNYVPRQPNCVDFSYDPSRFSSSTSSLVSDSDSVRSVNYLSPSGFESHAHALTYRDPSVDSGYEDSEYCHSFHTRPCGHQQPTKQKVSRRNQKQSSQGPLHLGRSAVKKNSNHEEHKRLIHKESEQKRRDDQKVSTEFLKRLFVFSENSTKQQILDTTVDFVQCCHKFLPLLRHKIAANDPVEMYDMMPILENLSRYFDGSHTGNAAAS